MKRISTESESITSIQKQIAGLKAQHTKDMENLYAYYARLYRQEQEDLRVSWDDCVPNSKDDPAFLAESTAMDVSYNFRLLCSTLIGLVGYPTQGTIQNLPSPNEIPTRMGRRSLPRALRTRQDLIVLSKTPRAAVRTVP